jgi:hypothetical protein
LFGGQFGVASSLFYVLEQVARRAELDVSVLGGLGSGLGVLFGWLLGGIVSPAGDSRLQAYLSMY